MSTQVLTSTTFTGMDIAINRKPQFMNRVQENVSGKETRIALRTVPRWTWEVTFNFARSTSAQANSQEFANLTSLFNTLSGGFDSFQWGDPEDNSESLGPATLVSTAGGTYQLTRAMGASTFFENIFAPNVVSQVFVVNSSGQSSGSTVGITQNNWGSTIPGQVTLSTFSPTPGSSASVFATFTYYWPVRWDQDEMQFDRFGYGWWEVKKMSFTSII